MALSNADLGNYLRKLRETKQLSTREVYELCGVYNSYLSLVENGHRRASAIVLKKLAPIYNVDYLSLYEKAGYIDLIKDETLALELIKKDLEVEISNLNGLDVKFDVERI